MSIAKRLAAIEKASRSDRSSDRSSVAQPALLILGRAASEHFIAVVAALEEHFAGHGELKAIEETLAELETEASPVAGSPSNRVGGRRRA